MRRVGLTLVEVLVAVILIGVSSLLAHAIVVSVAEGATTITGALDAEAHEAHWRDHVRRRLQLLSHDVRAGGFHGDSLGFAFGSLASGSRDPERWIMERRSDSLVLVAESGIIDAALGGLVTHHVEYLESPGSERPWLIFWESPASAPRAVRLRWRRTTTPTVEDTLVLLAGSDT